MGSGHKKKEPGKKQDGTFHSKQIKHDPNAESARAVFRQNDGAEHGK
ncbi:MAG: hypothetical protein H6Q60_849 [Oscillospiraceae bacterium]|nr:hypothetical protein [Oscillospiraceae bacterium]